MAKLFWLQPDNTIVEFPLKAEQTLIGRGSRCDVRIKHPGISSEHAIIRHVSGTATVEDMDSTNGTRINGKRIAQMQTLRHGDQIGVGRERLMYFAELDAAAHFVQPESVEPFALLAPGGESVNTAPVQRSNKSPMLMPDEESLALPATPTSSARASNLFPSQEVTPSSLAAISSDGMPLLDISLLAALPKGSSLNSSSASTSPPVPIHVAPAAAVNTQSATARALAPATAPAPVAEPPPEPPSPQTRQSLVGSVAVLSGPATDRKSVV